MIKFGTVRIDRRTSQIWNGDRCVQFSISRLPRRSIAFRLSETLLLAGPKTVEELFERMYGDDPDGGPEYANTCYVHLARMKNKLKKIGIHVKSDYVKSGPKCYWASVEQEECV